MNLILLAQASAATESAAPWSEPWKKATLQSVRSLNFNEIDSGDQWLYLATHFGYHIGLRALFVVVVMLLAWTLSGWASTAVRRAFTKIKFDLTLTYFIAKFVRWSLLLLAALACLSYFGIETTSFAAVIGAAGLAVGLAFQGTLSNFAAGGMLLVFRPYKIGDVVNIAGQLGKVEAIELFSTVVDTFDNRRITIPNSSIYGAVIENITFHPVRRADVDVGVSYAADIDATRDVLERAVRSVPQVLDDPAPAVILMSLGGSSVDWSVRGWAQGDEFLDAKQGILRAVKTELDRAGIEIPFPQLDVHLDGAVADARRSGV